MRIRLVPRTIIQMSEAVSTRQNAKAARSRRNSARTGGGSPVPDIRPAAGAAANGQ